ncbi:T9SS type A sorting domain-containing protein [Pontibacter sp. G13]|uniref:T9SS type A sorting domain-containing protein n=1 Tax=Pontibacter sp. G13 TaxID=3074898 RepID=UPI00288AAE65|nr:T9SS type A sorting domain-containing protein [Pontibacter sp. G13]WNJ15907.1 T9SS type A sorting domain-containing protein [Pontibacter sp. G13]
MMKRITLLALIVALGASSSFAQRIVNIPSIPGDIVDIFPYIMGDTTAGGDRVDNNTIYTLDNGGVYITTDKIFNKPEWPLQIQAVDLDNQDVKPVITRIPNTSGSYPNMFYPEGDMTLQNIWLIIGEKEGGQNHDWGKLRILGTGSKITVKDCILEKDRGGLLQVRADSVSIFVDNCVFRNGGNRRVLQGNGRAIDARNFTLDSLVFTNSLVYNMVDRVFRSQGATQPHNYIKFSHNTIFNIAGRHGCFQFSRVKELEVTNNMIQNPIMLGTTPAFTDEQNQPDAESHKVFTLDTLYAETSVMMAGNNVYWTQDVKDVWENIDSVSQPQVLSALMKDALGADTSSAYFVEDVVLNSIPANITQYVQDLYDNPASDSMYDFVVEDLALQGTEYDLGNLFDFSTFDACYGSGTASATAGTNGQAIGYTLACTDLVSILAPELVDLVNFQTYPNPVSTQAFIRYELPENMSISVEVLDIQGRTVETLVRDFQLAGEQTITWKPQGISNGLYLIQLTTPHGQISQKVLLNK